MSDNLYRSAEIVSAHLRLIRPGWAAIKHEGICYVIRKIWHVDILHKGVQKKVEEEIL